MSRESQLPLGELDSGPPLACEAPGSPFDGMTVAQAEVLNGALTHRRVIVGGGKFTPDDVGEYVFLRMFLPTDRGWFGGGIPAGWAAMFDLYLLRVGEDHRPVGGSYRVVSPALIWMFLTVEAPELSRCHVCSAWQPQSELRDSAFPEWGIEGYGLECVRCHAGESVYA